MFFVFVAGVVKAQVYYVTVAGTGAGSSWADAAGAAQLQTIIDAAPAGSQVWVAQGTYNPTGYPAGATGAASNQNWSFGLKNGVAVYGGFAGTETALTQRNPAVNVTILSADIGIINNPGDNCYHVVLSAANNNTAVLDGFTISHGHASSGTTITYNGQTILQNSGAGIACYASTPTINNCIFSTNNATKLGAAMYNVNGSGFNVTNCSFTGNKAGLSGGAIYNSNETVVFSSCNISQNTADASSGTIAGGGLFNTNLSNVTLLHCFLQADVASSAGTGDGGAIYNNNSALKDSACVFVANYSNNSNGGAIASAGGSLYNWNCVFVDNVAALKGGAIYNSGSTGRLVNSTLYNNTGTSGAGVYTTTGLNLYNDVVWGNIPDGIAVATSATVQYSDIQGGYAGTGNLNTDPVFVNSGNYTGPDGAWATADDGLELTYGLSPAIDAGVNNPGGGLSTLNDLINVSRPQLAGVDMGAYEAVYLVSMSLPPPAAAPVHTAVEAASFALQPSLVSGSTTLLLAKGIKQAGTVRVTVIDAAGRMVWGRAVSLAQGDNIVSVDVSRLAAGMYYLCIRGTGTLQATIAFGRQ